ncbi:MAG TPA: DUF3617 family protein [Caulobacteraceae bacterium]|nr:DUF3617 family protein [Caulobacteraceae bacterium]
MTLRFSAAIGAALLAIPALALPAGLGLGELPRPLPGRWQVSFSMNGGPPHVERNCMKGEPAQVTPKQFSRCQDLRVARGLGGFVVDGHCSGPNVDFTLHETISGDFRTKYLADSNMTMNVGGRSVTMHGRMESHYIGPC